MDPHWEQFQSEAQSTQNMLNEWIDHFEQESEAVEKFSFLVRRLYLSRRGEHFFERERCLGIYSFLIELDFDVSCMCMWRSEICSRLARDRTDERYLLQSLEDYERRIQLGANDIGARGTARLALGWHDDAIADLLQSNAASKHQLYFAELARAYIDSGKPESAIEFLNDRVDASDKNRLRRWPVALAIRSRAFEARGELARCEDDRDRLWQYASENRDTEEAIELYLKVHISAGNYRYVMDEIASRQHGKDIETECRLLLLKAHALRQLAGERFDEQAAAQVLDCFREATSLNYNFGAAWRDYIIELEKQWAYEELINLSTCRSDEDCVEDLRNGCIHHEWSLHRTLDSKESYWRGRLAALSEQYEEAPEYFEQRPDSEYDRMENCVCCYKMGDRNRALGMIERL